MLSETKNKILSVLISTAGAFLGFQALSYVIGIYQLSDSLYISFYIYAFHIFWLTFVFDLHLKKRGVLANARLNHSGWVMLKKAFLERVEHLRNWHYLRHYQNYLVLPGMIYWATVALMFMNPFSAGLKQSLALASTFALAVAYWFMKEHISRRLEHEDHWIRTLSLVKLYSAFIVFSSVVGVTFYFGYSALFLISATASLGFLLVYQALFQHRLLNLQIIFLSLGIALTMGLVSAVVYNFWNYQYFSAGLVMVAIYNFMWGVLHHHIDRTLTGKIVVEYLAMMIFIVSLVLGSHNFSQRII